MLSSLCGSYYELAALKHCVQVSTRHCSMKIRPRHHLVHAHDLWNLDNLYLCVYIYIYIFVKREQMVNCSINADRLFAHIIGSESNNNVNKASGMVQEAWSFSTVFLSLLQDRGPHLRGVQSRKWIAKSAASNVGKLAFLQLWPCGKGEQ